MRALSGKSFIILKYMYTQTTESLGSLGTLHLRNCASNRSSTIFTSGFPMIANFLMEKELHHSESARQKWLFIKIGLFNVLVTTVLSSITNPFTSTLDNKEESDSGLLTSVYGLFFSQLLITPALQLIDIGGNLARHVFAPRAKTQLEMNMNMKGSVVTLAERYANFVKFVFLMLWYSAIFPGGWVMGSVALFLIYFVDRFSIMRTWRRAPQIGPEIATFVRHYVTPATIVFGFIVSSYLWSGFPYDNICVDDTSELHPGYYAMDGIWNMNIPGSETKLFGFTVYKGPNAIYSFPINEGGTVYKYCNQDLRSYSGRSFPPLPKFQPEGSEWMTDDQESILQIFGWTSVAILGTILLRYFAVWKDRFVGIFQGAYTPRGEDMGIPYSKNKAIESYIPQFQSDLLLHPFFLCDIHDIDPMLFGWTDPRLPHSYH